MDLILPANAKSEDYKLNSHQRQNLQTKALEFYKVPGRYYHNYAHIYAMLDTHQKYFKHDPSDALFLAIIMHDAVYIPGQSPMSEDASAALVPNVYFRALAKPIPLELNDKVVELIHWTLPSFHVTNNIPRFRGKSSDAQTLLDLDLNAMATSDWREFVRTQMEIDREFAFIGTHNERCQKSAAFLHQFVEKGFIFYSEQMQSLNAIALENLRIYTELVGKGIYDFSDMLEAGPALRQT